MMAPIDLISWRALLGLPQSLAALELGIGARVLQAYEAGEKPVPRAIELACAALALGLRRYPSRVHDREDEPIRPLDLPALAGMGLTVQEQRALKGLIQGKRPVVSGSTKWFGRLYRLGIVVPEDAPTEADPKRQEWTLSERGRWATEHAGRAKEPRAQKQKGPPEGDPDLTTGREEF